MNYKDLDLKFAAIQVYNSFETPTELVGLFVRAANELGYQFELVEVFGPMTLGTNKFLRFRTDCPSISSVAARILNQKRGVIYPDLKLCYKVSLVGGREGPVTLTVMQAVALPGYPQAYKGPKMKFWEAQFEGAEKK